MIQTAANSPYSKIDWIPTGISSLDSILGGGIPSKRITEIHGREGLGKTTLAFMVTAQAQKLGLKTLWCDQEWVWEDAYPKSLGIDLTKLFLLQEQMAESTLDQVQEFADTKKNTLIVIDSVGGLLSRQEAEKTTEGKTIGGQAGLMAKFCRKIVPLLAMNNHALIVINHEFLDIGTGRLMTSGGAKLAYHKSISLRLRNGNKKVMQGENQIGEGVIAEIRKNKLAPTLKQTCDLTMIYGEGFSVKADLLQQLLDSGEVTKKGNTYFRGETKLGIGLNNARNALKS